MTPEKILVAGIATTVSAVALKKAYEVTNFYPPQPVFYFAIGATAAVGLALVAGKRPFWEDCRVIEDQK
jgi:hypothetical protein